MVMASKALAILGLFPCLAALPAAAGEIHRALYAQVLACEKAEAVATIATLQRQQPPDVGRIKMVSARGRCVTIPNTVILAVEARETSPAGTVALVRATAQAGDYAGGRWWVMADQLEMAGYERERR